MPAWRVRLEGTPGTLEDLPRLLPPACSIVKDDGRSYLESLLFSTLSEAAEVMALAARFLEAANLVAALRVPLWRPVACDAVAELREDGTRSWAKFLSASIATSASMTASPTVVRRDGTVEGPPLAPPFNNETHLVLQNDSLRQALSFLQEASWASLYKAYEIVRDTVGGEKKLRALRWVSGSLLTRFTRTCQSPKAIGAEARHGVEVGIPPLNPLTHAEAKRVAAGLLQHWVEQLLGQSRA